MSDSPVLAAKACGILRAEQLLKAVLRISGTTCILAIIPMCMPRSWIEIAHQSIGLGTFPSGPVPEYLARSASGLYAFLGGLWWVCSADIRRHRHVLLYSAIILTVFGGALALVDHRVGLPLWWRLVEGPVNILIGLLMLVLLGRIGPDPQARTDPSCSQHP